MTNEFEGPVDALAESISQRLERLGAGEPLDVVLSGVEPEAAEEVALAVELARLLPQRPDPVFRAALQVRLQTAMAGQAHAASVSAAARRSFGAVAVAWLRRSAPRLAGGVLAVALVAGSAAVAAAGSLPGDALYPVKRASEEARGYLIRDSADRAHYRLALADERLDEIRRLIELGVPIGPEVVDALLAQRQLAFEEARDATPAAQRDVADWSASRSITLLALADQDHAATSALLRAAASVMAAPPVAPLSGSQQPLPGVAPARTAPGTATVRAPVTGSTPPTETPVARASQMATVAPATRTPTPILAGAQVTSTAQVVPATAAFTAAPATPVVLTPGPGDDSRIDPDRATELARRRTQTAPTPDGGSLQDPGAPTPEPPTAQPPPQPPTGG